MGRITILMLVWCSTYELDFWSYAVVEIELISVVA
jgi:hypothetical protein